MKRDEVTNTEVDAGHYAQMQAYDDTDRDHDTNERDPRPVEDHDCVGDECRDMLCVLERTVARQREEREERRAWDEYKRSQRDEEAS